jgi:hypothetical protein
MQKMKKLLISGLLVVFVTASFANYPGKLGYFRPRTTVIVSGGFYTPMLYAPFWYGYPYYNYYMQPGVTPAPSKLDQEIADITHDYEQKIESTRMDSSLKGKERRQEIRALKAERDSKIDLAKRNYYKQ